MRELNQHVRSTLDVDLRSHSGKMEVEVRGLTRKVGDRILVDDVDVDFKRGEILAVAGPSGAGKSSFLRLLNRLDEPTGGTILIKGLDYREIEPARLRRQVGMVMQIPNLFSGSVRGNLLYGPAQRGETLTNGEVDELLVKVGLPGYDNRDVNTLSGGESQRVSLARTLANKPSVLLLDEPTSALDEESGRAIEELILNLAGHAHITCIVVTHNALQAVRLAGRTMYMQDGKLITVGPTKEVLNEHHIV